MVCLEVIYLLSKNEHPEVFAEEFDYVECVCKAWPVARESRRNATVVS